MHLEDDTIFFRMARINDAAHARGKACTDSITALVAKAIDASRIDTASGGASNPVATKATTSGQFESHTGLVVTSR